MNRRLFLGTALLSGAALLTARYAYTFFSNPTQVMLSVMDHLYPTSPLGFGVRELGVAAYMVGVVQDVRILPSDKAYLKKGARWIEEEAHAMYDKSFLSLNTQQKEQLLQTITQEPWGVNYINYLFNYIFEAIFSPPIYGTNGHEMGWKWAEHQAGFPLPTTQKEITYG